jgi:hypothetical protein
LLLKKTYPANKNIEWMLTEQLWSDKPWYQPVAGGQRNTIFPFEIKNGA